MSKPEYRIAVVPGDGIGPEVCGAALRVLQSALGNDGPLRFESYEAGATCYQKHGTALPAETLKGCREADAILHGAAGLPHVLYPDGTEAGQDFTLTLRRELDLYANVRPVKLYPGVTSCLRDREPGGIDYVIVREGTEGLYAARGGGNLLGDRVATDTMVVTRDGVARVVRFAAELARSRNGAPRDGVSRVTVVDKANVLRSMAFFRQVAREVLAEYPDVEADFGLIDAMTVHLVRDPDYYDVIVTENMFGDILSDLGAATVGGMGMSAAAEIGARNGYFQASHGSAPTIAGQGIANPYATVLSAAFMMDWLASRHDDGALAQAATRVQDAVTSVLREGGALPRDLGGEASTQHCADAVCEAMARGS